MSFHSIYFLFHNSLCSLYSVSWFYNEEKRMKGRQDLTKWFKLKHVMYCFIILELEQSFRGSYIKKYSERIYCTVYGFMSLFMYSCCSLLDLFRQNCWKIEDKTCSNHVLFSFSLTHNGIELKLDCVMTRKLSIHI